MKRKPTNWERYFKAQMKDPETSKLVEEELRSLRLGAKIAILRQKKKLSQTQLAAKTGMSGPNISRIETSSTQNLTLGTLSRIARARDYEVEVRFQPRRTRANAGKT